MRLAACMPACHSAFRKQGGGSQLSRGLLLHACVPANPAHLLCLLHTCRL